MTLNFDNQSHINKNPNDWCRALVGSNLNLL